MTSASAYSEEAQATSSGGDEPIATSQSTQLIARLPEKDLPAPASTWLAHGQVPRGGEPVVLMHQDALLQVAAHSGSNLNTELGGALLGTAYRHRGTVVVEIKAALPATSGDHGPVHFTFSADSWPQLQRDRTAQYPKLDIVGWFHTHPDLGVFYSGDDVVVHSAAFTLPWHVGMVVDPIRNEAAYFGWKNEVLQALAGFYELTDKQSQSVVRWTVPETAVWDGRYDPASTATESYTSQGATSMIAPPRSGTSITGRELGVLLGALSLLLTFLMLVGLIMPMRERIQTLETTALTLANEALADSNGLTCPDPRLRIISPLTGSNVPTASQIEIIGTAAFPNAARYQLDARRSGDQTWGLLDRNNQGERLGTLFTLDTSQLTAAEYELRLSAVDANNIRLGDGAICTIALNVVP